jgi:hypothetical protein
MFLNNLNRLVDLTPEEVASVYQAYDMAEAVTANNRALFPPAGAGQLVATTPKQKEALHRILEQVDDAATTAMEMLNRDIGR